MIRRWRERRLATRNRIVTDEGHLGGHVAASPVPAPSGLDVRNGDPATWSPDLWRWTVETLRVRSVLDIGCGEGHSTRFYRSLGCDALGVDGSLGAHARSVVPDAHVVHDFTVGSFVPTRAYDLVWSCEFVEHVEARYEENFLETFRGARRFLMMTHALPGQPGWHHVNCQPAEYWIERVSEIGFAFSETRTEQSRRIAEAGHYKRTGLFFERVRAPRARAEGRTPRPAVGP
ncbi:MAG: class I SAM-dependent methyltransferase [Gemmatimonadetes bacterium]|nr:class I SAM-dependent methyltransferase [Gemmatimonadota bacterium]